MEQHKIEHDYDEMIDHVTNRQENRVVHLYEEHSNSNKKNNHKIEFEYQKCGVCNNYSCGGSQRYPNAICSNCCRTGISDENGFSVEFSNTDDRGYGFVAIHTDIHSNKYSDTNSKCFIKGVECIAMESRFGGIVIIPKRR